MARFTQRNKEELGEERQVYVELLSPLEEGDGVEVELDESDNPRSIKRQFTAAASRLGIVVRYKGDPKTGSFLVIRTRKEQ